MLNSEPFVLPVITNAYRFDEAEHSRERELGELSSWTFSTIRPESFFQLGCRSADHLRSTSLDRCSVWNKAISELEGFPCRHCSWLMQPGHFGGTSQASRRSSWFSSDSPANVWYLWAVYRTGNALALCKVSVVGKMGRGRDWAGRGEWNTYSNNIHQEHTYFYPIAAPTRWRLQGC